MLQYHKYQAESIMYLYVVPKLKQNNRIRFVSKEGIEIEARNDWRWSISAGMLERELDDNNNDYVASEDELLALMGGC